MFDLRGKTAVVTGALGLLGREHAKALASAGASVVLTDLDQSRCEAFARAVSTETGVSALGVAADLTEPESIRALLREVLLRFDGVDVLVNNAAMNDAVEGSTRRAEAGSLEAYPVELFRQVLDVNVTSVFATSQIVGAEMARRGSGSIINIASTYGLVAPDQALYVDPDGHRLMYKSPAYPVSKAAVLQLTRYLATYWGPAGVRANSLSPGGVENGQAPWFVEAYARRTPLGRMARPQDYRGALVFLASDESRYMTGANLVVDGGFTAW